MIQTINFNQFCDGFPESYKDNFSYEGKQALFNYLEEYEDETGEKIEYDPIAFCCEYSEYESLKELQENYTDINSIDDLRDRTQVIMVKDFNDKETSGLIIQYY